MKYIKITIEGGCLRDVEGLPAGYGYELIDLDDKEECESCDGETTTEPGVFISGKSYCQGCGEYREVDPKYKQPKE